MKVLFNILVIGLFIGSIGCSKNDAQKAVEEGLGSIPDIESEEGKNEGDNNIVPLATGKNNGKAFDVAIGYLMEDPFDKNKAELILKDNADDSCWPFADRTIILPINDKAKYLGEHVVAGGDWSMAVVFYDSDNGNNLNHSEASPQGMKWTIEKDSNNDLQGYVEIASEGPDDNFYVEGSFPITNCL